MKQTNHVWRKGEVQRFDTIYIGWEKKYFYIYPFSVKINCRYINVQKRKYVLDFKNGLILLHQTSVVFPIVSVMDVVFILKKMN